MLSISSSTTLHFLHLVIETAVLYANTVFNENPFSLTSAAQLTRRVRIVVVSADFVKE
jgi:hypothetical protein